MYDYREERRYDTLPLSTKYLELFRSSSASCCRLVDLSCARILKTEDVCFLLTATFLHIPCGNCLLFSHSLKWRTERTMPICSIVPQVPHYVLYIILLQTQKELSCNNVFLFVFKLNKSRFQITLGVFSFCLQCEVKFHHELRFLV